MTDELHRNYPADDHDAAYAVKGITVNPYISSGGEARQLFYVQLKSLRRTARDKRLTFTLDNYAADLLAQVIRSCVSNGATSQVEIQEMGGNAQLKGNGKSNEPASAEEPTTEDALS